MKKLLTLILIVLIFSSFSQKTFAQDKVLTQVPHVEYELPYPGILPDNPLYFLKAIRDSLLGSLTTDPVKKASYSLLMSDKRLASSKSLLEMGKGELAITTLSKSGNYFDQAINQIAQAKRNGENTNSVIERLLIASKKHQEVIFQMAQKSSGLTKYNLELLQQRAKSFQDRVEVLDSN